jgi:transcriptional regulatory protein GAL4
LESQVNPQTAILQQETISGDTEVPSTILAVDPTLQMLFENTLWDKDVFQGLHGFSSTGEGEAFDYLPSNTEQGWFRSSDFGGQ